MLNSCSRNKSSEHDPQNSVSGKEGIWIVQSGTTEKVTERELEAARQSVGGGRLCTLWIGLPTLNYGSHFTMHTSIKTPDCIPYVYSRWQKLEGARHITSTGRAGGMNAHITSAHFLYSYTV